MRVAPLSGKTLVFCLYIMSAVSFSHCEQQINGMPYFFKREFFDVSSENMAKSTKKDAQIIRYVKNERTILTLSAFFGKLLYHV